MQTSLLDTILHIVHIFQIYTLYFINLYLYNLKLKMYRHHVNKTATNASVAKRNVLLDEDNDSGLSSGGRLDFTMTFSVIEEERLLDTMDYEDCECDSALGFDMEEEVAAIPRNNNQLYEDDDSGLVSDGRLDFSVRFNEMVEARLEGLMMMDHEQCDCDSMDRRALRDFVTTEVVPLCCETLMLDTGSELEIQEENLEAIIDEMIRLGEQEPCGVSGGVLVIHLGECLEEDEVKCLGRLPISPDNTATFELHLHLIPSTNIKHKVANLARRMQAKPPIIIVDQNFKIVKKKLYRSYQGEMMNNRYNEITS